VVKPTLSLTPGTTVEEAERRLILMTLEHTRDNKTRAAEILGISLKTLHNKLNKLRGRVPGKRESEESFPSPDRIEAAFPMTLLILLSRERRVTQAAEDSGDSTLFSAVSGPRPAPPAPVERHFLRVRRLCGFVARESSMSGRLRETKMRLGIKGKQIAAVTAIVGFAVVALSALHLTRLARVALHESQARGQLLSNAIFHRAREVVTETRCLLRAPGRPGAAGHPRIQHLRREHRGCGGARSERRDRGRERSVA